MAEMFGLNVGREKQLRLGTMKRNQSLKNYKCIHNAQRWWYVLELKCFLKVLGLKVWFLT